MIKINRLVFYLFSFALATSLSLLFWLSMSKSNLINNVLVLKIGLRNIPVSTSFKLVIYSLFTFGLPYALFGQEFTTVPFTLKTGYGPFQNSFYELKHGAINEDEEISKPYIAGFPSTYQVVTWGLFPYDFSKYLVNQRSSIKSVPVEIEEGQDHILTKSDLIGEIKRSYIRFVIGYDIAGALVVRFDANYNDDFSDEKDYLFVNSESSEFFTEMIHLSLNDFENDKGMLSTIPIVLKFSQTDGSLYYSVPIYGEGTLFDHHFKVNFGFTLDHENLLSEIIFTHDTSKKVSKDELLKIDKRVYRNRGIDLQNQSLNLERIPVNFKIWSNHQDDYSPDFAGNEFSTSELISSELLKGKYIFMDFWGSWCGPCIAEIPNLKKAIATLENQNILFLGIANDTKKSLGRAIVRYGIEWPQILSDRSNLILEKFNISNYPTTLLIGPDGKVIAENIHGESLAEYIKELIEIYDLILNEE